MRLHSFDRLRVSVTFPKGFEMKTAFWEKLPIYFSLRLSLSRVDRTGSDTKHPPCANQSIFSFLAAVHQFMIQLISLDRRWDLFSFLWFDNLPMLILNITVGVNLYISLYNNIYQRKHKITASVKTRTCLFVTTEQKKPTMRAKPHQSSSNGCNASFR